MSCPSLEALAALVASSAVEPAYGVEEAVHAHLARGCGLCERRVASLRSVAGDLLRFEREPARPHVARFARDLPRTQDGSLRRGWRELVATLQRPSELVPAFRASGDSESPAVYQVEGFELDLTWLLSGALVGQVLPAEAAAPEFGPGEVTLFGVDRAEVTELLATGEFRFGWAPRCPLTLAIEADRTRIVVEDVGAAGR